MSEENPQMTAEQLLELAKAGVLPQASETAAAEEVDVPKDPPMPEILHACPKCAHRLRNPDGTIAEYPVPTEEETREYMRRILSRQRYTKTYNMFEGQVKITFSTLSSNQTKELERISQIKMSADKDDVVKSLSVVKMLSALRSIEANGEVRKFGVLEQHDSDNPVTADTYLQEFDYKFGDDDEWLVVMLFRVHTQFQRLVALLSEAAFSENFWKGAGLK